MKPVRSETTIYTATLLLVGVTLCVWKVFDLGNVLGKSLEHTAQLVNQTSAQFSLSESDDIASNPTNQ